MKMQGNLKMKLETKENLINNILSHVCSVYINKAALPVRSTWAPMSWQPRESSSFCWLNLYCI
jgi:hypothetical protein